MTAASEARGELRSVQVARGIAALLVAAFHLSIMLQDPYFGHKTSFLSVTWWGFRGVDFFFVLSGFIILLAHRGDIGRPDRVGRYLYKRTTRIYPIYWLYTALVLTLSALGSGVVLSTVSTPATLWSSLTLIRFGTGEPPVGVAWTLFHEIVFYAAFASLILNRRMGLLLFAGWLAAILFLQLWPTPHSPLGTLFGAYNLNFFLGIAAFLTYRLLGPKAAAAALGGGMVLLGLMLYTDASGEASFAVHAGFACAFALLIAGAAGLERSGWRVSLPGLELLGNASYSLYLTHATMELYLVMALARLGLVQAAPGWLLYFGLLAATLVIGVLAYLLAERPLLALTRAWSNRRRAARNARSPVAAGVEMHS